MSLSHTTRSALQVAVVCQVLVSCCFGNNIKRFLTPSPLNSELQTENITMVINCTNDDVPPGLRNNTHVLFYLLSCRTNVNSLCPEDKDSATVLGILGKEINKTSGKLNHWGWVAKEGFPHYMVLHLTLALAEVAHCFSCHRLYNYPFPTDAEWYNTSEVCISHGLDDLQLAGQISTRALSITLSTPRQVFFIERPSGECTVEKMVQLNTVLLVVAIVLIVFIAACVLYWVRCRKRTRRTPKTKIPVNDTESQLPLSDTEIQKSLNETESQQPFVETVEDHDNKKNSYISLHEEPLGNVSVRPNSRSPGPPVT